MRIRNATVPQVVGFQRTPVAPRRPIQRTRQSPTWNIFSPWDMRKPKAFNEHIGNPDLPVQISPFPHPKFKNLVLVRYGPPEANTRMMLYPGMGGGLVESWDMLTHFAKQGIQVWGIYDPHRDTTRSEWFLYAREFLRKHSYLDVRKAFLVHFEAQLNQDREKTGRPIRGVLLVASFGMWYVGQMLRQMEDPFGFLDHMIAAVPAFGLRDRFLANQGRFMRWVCRKFVDQEMLISVDEIDKLQIPTSFVITLGDETVNLARWMKAYKTLSPPGSMKRTLLLRKVPHRIWVGDYVLKSFVFHWMTQAALGLPSPSTGPIRGAFEMRGDVEWLLPGMAIKPYLRREDGRI